MLGSMLKKFRVQHAMTQVELSEILGVTQESISGWERNRFTPDYANLLRLARLYHTSIDSLFEYHPEADAMWDVYVKLMPDQKDIIQTLINTFAKANTND
ncbi:MAG: helix-turn-helix transcriptional regulator [Bacillota bacterium]